MITATNQSTGEVVELPDGSLEELIASWQVAQQYAKLADRLKDQLKTKVEKYVDDGKSPEVSGYQFKVSSVQRMTYDKAILRQNLDEDTFDVLMQPDKTAVDRYLKENLDDLGERSTIIRQSMTPVGTPYQVIKLEKLTRSI